MSRDYSATRLAETLQVFHRDHANRLAWFQHATKLADAFLCSLDGRPAGEWTEPLAAVSLPEQGIGLEGALNIFTQTYLPKLSGSAGGRYWGFVTGGSTIPAIIGDWLVSATDQNATAGVAPTADLERDTIAQLRTLFGLPNTFEGSFVSGATMSNMVGLAIGRQWAGRERGIDVTHEGMAALPSLRVLSGTPHSSVLKSLAMLGIGRNRLISVACLPGREAIDPVALENVLRADPTAPTLVVANAGTVNTTDYDDLQAIAALRERYRFWLHVDAAFGGFAGCSSTYAALLKGWAAADSICIDLHKWLNVPYDSAIQLSRHRGLQIEAFGNQAAYLGEMGESPDYVHLTPENSRRWRALPAWMTLQAYGAAGYQALVEQSCNMAMRFAGYVGKSEVFKLLAPVRLNVVCFALRADLQQHTNALLAALQADGDVYLTPTHYAGVPAIRAAFCNWRIGEAEVDRGWEAMQRTVEKLGLGVGG